MSTTVTAAALTAKKAAVVAGTGGAVVASVAWHEHFAHWWPIILTVIGFIFFLGKFMQHIKEMERSNSEQHKDIADNLGHAIQRVEMKFETFSEKLNHRDSVIGHLKSRVDHVEERLNQSSRQ